METRKKSRKFIVGSLAVVLLGLCAIFGAWPLKATDPSDPKFNPDNFSFNDHRFDREAKIAEFKALFPVGTPKAFVDRVLVDTGGGRILQIEAPKGWEVWRYDEPPIPFIPGSTGHIFLFDSAGKVQNIYFALSETLYPENITHKQVREQLRAEDGRP